MFKEKNKVFEMILSFFLFLFLIFHLGILRALFVIHFQIYFEINILLIIFEFILSIFLSYKFYKLLRNKPFSIIKSFIITDIVIITLYFITLILFLMIGGKLISINAVLNNMFSYALATIFILILLYLAIIAPLMFGYQFYKNILDLKSLEEFKTKRDKFFDVESKIRFGLSNGWQFNMILVSIISLVILFILNYLMLGLDFDMKLLFECGALSFLSVMIISSVFKSTEFIISLYLLGAAVILIVFSLGLIGQYLIDFRISLFLLFYLCIVPSIYLIIIIFENNLFKNRL